MYNHWRRTSPPILRTSAALTLHLERYCLQPSRPEHSEYRGLFGFNWNLNMLTSMLLTLREFSLFPFSQALAIKQRFHWPQLCLLAVSVLLFILAAAEQSRVKAFSIERTRFQQMRPVGVSFTQTDPNCGHLTRPRDSSARAGRLTLESQGHGDSNVDPPPDWSPPSLPCHATGSLLNTSYFNCPG